MTDLPKTIRFTVSREHALASGSRFHGAGCYEPDDEELASLSVTELAVLSVFQGDPDGGHRLKLTRFSNPPWDAIVERLREALGPNAKTFDSATFADVTRAGLEHLGVSGDQARRDAGAVELADWLSSYKVPVNIPFRHGFNFVANFTVNAQASARGYPVAEGYVLSVANVVAQLDLQLAAMAEPFVASAEMLNAMYTAIETRPSPTLFALSLHDRLATAIGKLRPYLPSGVVLEQSEVVRMTARIGKEKSSAVMVEVSHPAATNRFVAVFSAEAETS